MMLNLRKQIVKCASKTTGPLFTDADIERVSKYLRQNHNSLLSNIFKSMKTEIMCCKASRVLFWIMKMRMIYDVRPKACREFPQIEKSFNRSLI
jgi:hypothetical protein